MSRRPLKPRNRDNIVLQGEVIPPEKQHGTGHGGFQKGMAKPTGSGRKKGQQNTVTTLLKEAIVLAASNVGDKLENNRGLMAFLENCAQRFPKSYMHLLARVLPYQVNASVDHEHRVFRTEQEVEEEMRKRGIPIPKYFN